MELLGYFTTKGRALSAKLLTGTALRITRVTAGDGVTEAEAVALVRDCQTLAVNPMKRSGDTVTLPATLVAAQAEEDYTLREVGVYAEDPDEGEILYRVYRLEPEVPIAAGGQLVIRFDLQETVSESAEITVAGTATGLLLEGDLDDLKAKLEQLQSDFDALIALRGAANGLATLGADGKVPESQMPYTYGTTDLTAGTSALVTGRLHFVYE